MKNKPQEGYHSVHCSECGVNMGRVTHYGGKEYLDNCDHCKDIKQLCYECWQQYENT